MMQQMMRNLEVARQSAKKPDNEAALDAYPDDPRDAMGSPIPGHTVLREGKYAKLKIHLSVEDMYTSDKEYIQWVRSRINAKSGVEMQKLRIYVYHRDQRKKKRMEEENHFQDQRQTPMPPQAVQYRMSTAMPAQGTGRQPGGRQARDLPKPMKTRALPLEEGEMEVDGWGIVVESGKTEETWKAMTLKVLQNQEVKTKDLAVHLQTVPREKVAGFMMNMIYMG